jgi:hypothetical protein
MRFLGWGFAFVAAAIFIVMLVGAQMGCPIPTCRGPGGDAWMPAFFGAIRVTCTCHVHILHCPKNMAKFASFIPCRALAKVPVFCDYRIGDPIWFYIWLSKRTITSFPSNSGASIGPGLQPARFWQLRGIRYGVEYTFHSCRSATMGSTRMARRAGT